jgi:hypothetical protein
MQKLHGKLRGLTRIKNKSSHPRLLPWRSYKIVQPYNTNIEAEAIEDSSELAA